MLLVSQLGNIVANLELVDTDINLVVFGYSHLLYANFHMLMGKSNKAGFSDKYFCNRSLSKFSGCQCTISHCSDI